MKRVKRRELDTLLRECFTKTCKENGFEHHEMTVKLQINSIYGKLEFSFKDKDKGSVNKVNGIAEDFANNLRNYTGNNIGVYKVPSNITDDSYIIILKIDYDIVE